MTAPADNAETERVDELIAAAGDLTIHGQEELAAEVVRLRDALLAQAETVGLELQVANQEHELRVAAEAERDAAEKRVVELVEGHDLERLSAERDAAVRAAEQAQERITELHAALERTNESFLATERSAEQAQEALRLMAVDFAPDLKIHDPEILATDDDALYRLESRIAFAKLHRHAGIELPVDLAEEIIGRLRSVPAGEEAAATAPTNEGSPTPISDSSASAGANPVDDALDILRKLAEERLIYDLIWALYDSGALTYQQAARLARGAVS